MRGRAHAIAINTSYQRAPWADVLYAADAKWWDAYEGVPSFQGLKFSLQPAAGRWPGVTVLENTGEWGLELAPTGLRTGRNSGYQAINVAVHMGAARILLIGYDMQQLPGEPSHWHGDHPPRVRGHIPFELFIHCFGELVRPLAELGVEVINCSRRTALTCFPRATLRDVL